jgi:putative ABC transport system permease protein
VAVTTRLDRVRLRLPDLWRISFVGLHTRKLRASLSALGIAIGVAAIVAVLGLSSSSESRTLGIDAEFLSSLRVSGESQ